LSLLLPTWCSPLREQMGNTDPPRPEKQVPRSGEGRRRKAGPGMQSAPAKNRRGVCDDEARGLGGSAEAVPALPGSRARRRAGRLEVAGVSAVGKDCSKGVSHRSEDRWLAQTRKRIPDATRRRWRDGTGARPIDCRTSNDRNAGVRRPGLHGIPTERAREGCAGTIARRKRLQCCTGRRRGSRKNCGGARPEGERAPAKRLLAAGVEGRPVDVANAQRRCRADDHDASSSGRTSVAAPGAAATRGGPR